MRSAALVPATAHDEQVLDEFDRLVREELPTFITGAAGRAGIRYRNVLIIGMSWTFRVLDTISALCKERRPNVGAILIQESYLVVAHFLMFPLLVHVLNQTSITSVQKKCGRLTTFLAGCLAILIMFPIFSMIYMVNSMARESAAALAVYCACVVVAASFTAFAFRPVA